MRNLLMISIVLFLFSCQSGNEERNAEKQIRDEIYAIHDDVMPKTSEIHRLKRQLKKFPDQNVADPVVKKQILETVVILEKADEGMMSWMNSFKEPAKLRKAKTHEEIMVYLDEEKAKISQVRSDMLNSIETAKALLATLKPEDKK